MSDMHQPKMVSETRVFEGRLQRWSHQSESTRTEMTFSIFLPPGNSHPSVLIWLSGLTCTDENFVQKAGAFRVASELGLAIVCPDTSPRGLDLPEEHDNYDFGSGAGFYVDATNPPWDVHYRMYSYVTRELPALIESSFDVSGRYSISGHSMGGHGALVCALKNPGQYQSVSAFAPITNPIQCPWGKKAFQGYLGRDVEAWKDWDTVSLIKAGRSFSHIRVEQGTKDNFLEEQLQPQALKDACEEAGQALTLNMREGYDHSYFFIASFIEDDLRYHADALNNTE
ncbi:S-formylglutathione hydrolase [Marinobacter nauticus]|uniref:S-formylglutathione hydrolase n=1 Tax=Marinobacter nauticus TaxID=2743 RepID=A0A1M2URU8_MARNT|nr:S-formylglutathione hydrolase [Marinobacter nauticus]OJS98049.1 S-formylglutathione hydrolase [Marinobacter nauticus]